MELNSILIEGNLVRDPEYRLTPTGKAVCTFCLATHYFTSKKTEKDEPVKETSFFDVEVWSKNAETCRTYLKRGSGVRVIGRLRQDRWMDTENKPKNKIKIVGEYIDFKDLTAKPKQQRQTEALQHKTAV